MTRSARRLSLVALLAACGPKADAPPPAATATRTASTAAPVPYGANPAAAGTFEHDGVKLYYETYGEGEPLLLIHGNGGSIGTFVRQIDHFKSKYRVIAMDSRSQGRSGDRPGPLTYEMMADDQAALLEHLRAGPAYVFGWSDGGIEALLLGMRHPDRVKMIAAGSANLNPTDRAFHPAAVALIKEMVASIPDSVAATPEGRRQLQATEMMTHEPNIELSAIERITAPTLILAPDQDVIRGEHTLAIFEHLKLGQLVIFPNATHMVFYDDADLVNAAVERFFATPFTKPKDRITDMMASYEQLLASLPK